MYNLSEAIKAIVLGHDAIVNFAKFTTSATRADIEPLGKIAPGVKTALQSLDEWFESTKPTKVVVLHKEGIKVSNTGRFYRLDDVELRPVWYDGEMRLILGPENIKRCSVLVAIAFDIKSNSRDSMIIEYRDGDRRNLTPENLFWVRKTTNVNPATRLVEDVCQRIVQFNGNIQLILDQYQGSQPVVSESYVKQIIDKVAFTSISDFYFTVENNEIMPVQKIVGADGNGIDCYGLLMNIKDKKLVEDMLKQKVSLNQSLSQAEMEIIAISAYDPNINTLKENILKKFGLGGLSNDDINRIFKAPSQTRKTIEDIYKEGL